MLKAGVGVSFSNKTFHSCPRAFEALYTHANSFNSSRKKPARQCTVNKDTATPSMPLRSWQDRFLTLPCARLRPLRTRFRRISWMSFTSLALESQQQSIRDHPRLSTTTPSKLTPPREQTLNKHRPQPFAGWADESKQMGGLQSVISTSALSPCAASRNGDQSSGPSAGEGGSRRVSGLRK